MKTTRRPPQILTVEDIGSGCVVPADQDASFLRPLERLRRQTNALQLARVQAAIRNVKIQPGGWFVPHQGRTFQILGDDWRWRYARLLTRLFPGAWVYHGAAHLALHKSPPAGASNLAGPCLFRIVQFAGRNRQGH